MTRFGVCVGFAAALAVGAAGRQDKKKPEVRATLDGHRGGVTAVAFGPKGSNLVATAAGNGSVRLWAADTGKRLATLTDFANGPVVGLAFLADAAALVAATPGVVVVWDVSDPAAPKHVSGPTAYRSEDRYVSVSRSGDGKVAYVASGVGSYQRTGTIQPVLPNGNRSTDGMLSPGFRPLAAAGVPAPESRMVAAYGLAGANGVPALYQFGLGDPREVRSAGMPAPAEGHAARVLFSPDAKWLGVCTGVLGVWKVPGSQIVTGDPVVVTRSAFAAALGPDGRAATATAPAETGSAAVTLWKLGEKPAEVAKFPTAFKEIPHLAFSPDGDLLAVADQGDGVVQLWAVPK